MPVLSHQRVIARQQAVDSEDASTTHVLDLAGCTTAEDSRLDHEQTSVKRTLLVKILGSHSCITSAPGRSFDYRARKRRFRSRSHLDQFAENDRKPWRHLSSFQQKLLYTRPKQSLTSSRVRRPKSLNCKDPDVRSKP